MKINKSMIILFGSLIVSALLIFYVFKKYPIGAVLDAFENITPNLLIWYLVVSVLLMVVFAIRWKILLKAQGIENVTFHELVSYRIVDYGIGYLTPTGKLAGEPIRAAMLMRNGYTFKQGLTSITIDKTIELSFTALMFVIGCLLLLVNKAFSASIAVFILAICAFLIFLNWTFYSKIFRGKPVFLSLFKFLRLDKIKKLAKYQLTIVDFERPILEFYKEKKKAYFIALGFTMLSFVLSMIEYGLLLRMVGIMEPTLKQTFMVFSVVGISFLLPVPMGLGSLETMQAWLFSSMGYSSAAGIGLAVITRSRDLLWVFAAIGFALYYGSLKLVLAEAFNSTYTNPVVKMTVFRGGRQDYLDIKMVRKKESKDYVELSEIRKRYHPINNMKKPVVEKKKPDPFKNNLRR